MKPFQFKTEVTLSQDDKNKLTILEVVTPDRPGLLSIMANLFVEFDIHLLNAKITTLGERVEDVFYIAKQSGGQIEDTKELSARISKELDNHVKQVTA